jgi:hypothetical protein
MRQTIPVGVLVIFVSASAMAQNKGGTPAPILPATSGVPSPIVVPAIPTWELRKHGDIYIVPSTGKGKGKGTDGGIAYHAGAGLPDTTYGQVFDLCKLNPKLPQCKGLMDVCTVNPRLPQCPRM